MRRLFQLDAEAWNLIVAWTVLAWLEDVPVPILGLLGPNGAGKSYLARALIRLVDPKPGDGLESFPALSEWVAVMGKSRAFVFDNASSISAKESDALCRAVTGDTIAKRALWTNEDAVARTFRRAIILTSIDPGALRGDLGDRLMPIGLERIPPDRRLPERRMNAVIERESGAWLGGLLALIARVLENPVELEALPRMADAAEVMAALDRAVPSSAAVSAYYKAIGSVTERVLEADPLSQAVLGFMEKRKSWQGTATELYEQIDLNGHRPDHNWPASPQGLSERLTRLQSALEESKALLVERGYSGSARAIRIKWASDAE